MKGVICMKVDLQGYAQEILQKKIETYHIVVRQHDEIVGRFDFRKDNRRDNIHSVSKSFVSMAVGMAVEEGILSLDERPAEIFRDKLPQNPSENLMNITIRDMLMMAAGHDYFVLQGYSGDPKYPGRDELTDPDWVKYALSFPVPYAPGTHWKYSNFGPYLCSVIIQDRTGKRLRDYLMPRLFGPLNIINPQWFESTAGYTLGCGGLHLNTEEMARFGQLILNKGNWKGRQLISAQWVETATSNLISNVNSGKGPDSTAGYGYYFWRCARDGACRGDGWAGQYVIVLPEQDACIAIMSHDFNKQGILDAVWEYVVPQLKGN